MNRTDEAGNRKRLEVGLCLLLALSFLYNPFLAIASPSGRLNFSHCASYRATVASTELQSLSAKGHKAPDLPVTLLSNRDVVTEENDETEFFRALTEARPVLEVLSDYLWVRPPPTI